MSRLVLEPLLGSLGILVAGFITIPLAGEIAVAEISGGQGFVTGLIFFVLRFAWLWVLRFIFSKHHAARTP